MDTAATAMKPLIGVTTYLEKADTEGCGRVSAAFLPETYLDAILVAGVCRSYCRPNRSTPP
jgi:putative glutamine amidotransferase